MPSARWDREYRRRRDALRRHAKATNAPCHLCGHPIDYNLDYIHPMSFTADHLTPVAAGGSMTGPLAPAHRSCNSRKGARTGTEQPATPRTTRAW